MRVNAGGRIGVGRMIVFWIVLGFVAACTAIWLLVFPEARERLVSIAAAAWRTLAGKAAAGGGRIARRAEKSGHAVRSGGSGMAGVMRRHRLVLAIAALVLCVPPVLILMLRQQVVLESFTGEDLSVSRSTIAVLMRGERLVPPPAPPPEVFTTAEAQRAMPEIATADRRWERLDPDLQQRVLAIYRVLAQEHGIRMVLVQGYRSPEQQEELYRQGRVTRAAAWQSCHQYGLALDSAPMRDGKLQWDMEDPWTRRAYFLYGELAQEAGLVWGGSWSWGDFGHVEVRQACLAAREARRRAG
ncbi:M15 family metallopeptidase [Luteimonas sp. MJ293]|uniref:M15 family metallopeptidase n=1 Tax=Luteimonas sp. MJ146 TaxID=3129240 RepID=UPI0031B9FBD3